MTRRIAVGGAWIGTILLGALWPVAAVALTLYALVDTGELFASADGGASWSVRSTLPVRDAVALVAGNSSSELFLASASGAVYRSTNAGTAWTAVGSVPAPDVVAMFGAPGRLSLFTRSGGVYVSVDGGTGFTPAGAIPSPDLASATRQGTEEYALGRSGLVFRSTNGGVDWNAVGSLPVTDAVAITAHGNELYVLTSTGAVARSLDQGAGWTFIAALSQGGMGALAAGGAELVAVTRAGEIAASANGTSWTWRGSVGQLAVRALASDVPTNTGVDPASPGALAFSAPWPNPASRAVSFTFDLEREAVVTLEVFDAAGRRVALPIAGERLPAGRVTRQWRPERLEGGTYFARVVTPGRTLTRGFVWLAGRSSGALR